MDLSFGPLLFLGDVATRKWTTHESIRDGRWEFRRPSRRSRSTHGFFDTRYVRPPFCTPMKVVTTHPKLIGQSLCNSLMSCEKFICKDTFHCSTQLRFVHFQSLSSAIACSVAFVRHLCHISEPVCDVTSAMTMSKCCMIFSRIRRHCGCAKRLWKAVKPFLFAAVQLWTEAAPWFMLTA